MKIPVLKGTIRRRILVNYRADATVIQKVLPSPFRPKLYNGHAIVGVCLIRLENIRPAACALSTGFSSENAAHRIAVEWDGEDGKVQEGVFIPRRDTGSVLNHVTGGRLFPGQHHRATFRVSDDHSAIAFHMQSHDGSVEVRITGREESTLPSTSCFPGLTEASAFFEGGCLGYSARCNSDRLDALLLQTKSWHVEVLEVSDVYSSYFSNERLFAQGSITFDHALIMRDIEHEWHAAAEMKTAVNLV